MSVMVSNADHCECAAQYGRPWHRHDCPLFPPAVLTLAPSWPRVYPTNYFWQRATWRHMTPEEMRVAGTLGLGWMRGT